jgi:hypothetical protein
MKHILKTILIAGMLIGPGTKASEDRLVIEHLQTPIAGVTQTVVYVNEQDFQRIIPEEMRTLMEGPRTQHQIIEPMSLFSLTAAGFKKRYHYVDIGAYKLMDKNELAETPFLGTSDLHDCVGVAIKFPGRRAGLMHVSRRSYEAGKFAKFLSFFPDSVRAKCSVSLKSSVWSVLLSNILKGIKEGGFGDVSSDINPIYLTFETEPILSGGSKITTIKYSAYERDGLTPVDIQRLNGLKATISGLDVLKQVSKFRAKAADPLENPRGLLLNFETGVSYEFFTKGYLSANGLTFQKLNFVFNAICKCVPISQMQFVIMQKKLAEYREGLEKNLAALRSSGSE